MAFRFQKRKKVGIFNITFGKKGIGISVGNKWLRGGISSDGKLYSSYRIPGTGLSKVEYHTSKKTKTIQQNSDVVKIKEDIFFKPVNNKIDISFLKKIKKPYSYISTKGLIGRYTLATFGWFLFPPFIVGAIPLYFYWIYKFMNSQKNFNKLSGKGFKGSFYENDNIYPAELIVEEEIKIKTPEKEIKLNRPIVKYITQYFETSDILSKPAIAIYENGNIKYFIFASNLYNIDKDLFGSDIFSSFNLQKNKFLIFQNSLGIGKLDYENREDIPYMLRFPHRFLFLTNVEIKEEDNLVILSLEDLNDGKIFNFYLKIDRFLPHPGYKEENVFSILQILTKYNATEDQYIKAKEIFLNKYSQYQLSDIIDLEIDRIIKFSKSKKEKVDKLRGLENQLMIEENYEALKKLYETILTINPKAGVKRNLDRTNKLLMEKYTEELNNLDTD